jgi:transposase
VNHPAAVIEKARRLESLLQRVEAGEPFEQVRAELDLHVEAADLPKLQARYVASGRNWEVLIDGRYGHTQKVTSAMREWLYEQKRQNAELTAPALADALERQFGVRVAAGHINHLLRKVGLTRPPGRPYKSPAPAPATATPTAVEPAVANAGLFFPGGRQAGAGDQRSCGDHGGDRRCPVSGRPSGRLPAHPDQ